MISLSKSGNTVTFAFDDNSGYLQNGTIDVPVNSLSLVIDSSDMVTFKKSASNDIFVSALASDFGMSKSELEAWYKENMVGSTGGGGGGGITSGEVQTMIDTSISGKVDTSANTVPDYYVPSTIEYIRYWPSQNEHATYANGLSEITIGGSPGSGTACWGIRLIISDEQGNEISGSTCLERGEFNDTSAVPYALRDHVSATTSSWTADYVVEDGWKIVWIEKYNDYDGYIFGEPIYIPSTTKLYDGGQSADVIEDTIEPELVRLDSEKQDVLSAGTGISISGNVISAKITSAISSYSTDAVQSSAVYSGLTAKVDVSANTVPATYNYVDYTTYFPESGTPALYIDGVEAISLKDFNYSAYGLQLSFTFVLATDYGWQGSGSTLVSYWNFNNSSILPSDLSDSLEVSEFEKISGSSYNVTWKPKASNVKIIYAEITGSDSSTPITLKAGNVNWQGGQSADVIKNVIEPELINLNTISIPNGSGGTTSVTLQQAIDDIYNKLNNS